MKRSIRLLLIFIGIFLSLTTSQAAELGGDYTTKLCPNGLNIPSLPEIEAELELMTPISLLMKPIWLTKAYLY